NQRKSVSLLDADIPITGDNSNGQPSQSGFLHPGCTLPAVANPGGTHQSANKRKFPVPSGARPAAIRKPVGCRAGAAGAFDRTPATTVAGRRRTTRTIRSVRFVAEPHQLAAGRTRTKV